MRRIVSCATFACALLALATVASAQSTVREIVDFLVTNQSVPTADFERDRAAAEAARDTITSALLVNLTSVPLATSSSGFLYRLNPALGTVERATESFGAFYVERALPPGHGRTSFGVTVTTAAFDRLDGQALRDGSLVTVANQFRDEAEPFDTEALTLRVATSAMTFLASTGITDRLEVGAAVPFLRLTLEGQRLNVYYGTPLLQAVGSATSSGVGDVALRAKYTLLAARDGGVAASGEVRLPTGNAENLLGAGALAWRLSGVASFERGPVSLHGNGGIVRGGVSDEIVFGGAASYAVQPRVTVSGELVGRRLDALRDLGLISAPHPAIEGVDTFRLTGTGTGAMVLDALAGAKWNVARTLVLGGHIRWHVSTAGLTAPITPTVALEYAF